LIAIRSCLLLASNYRPLRATGLTGRGHRDVSAPPASHHSERDKYIGFPQTEPQNGVSSKDKIEETRSIAAQLVQFTKRGKQLVKFCRSLNLLFRFHNRMFGYSYEGTAPAAPPKPVFPTAWIQQFPHRPSPKFQRAVQI
jgi:hypothetical protein